MVNKLITLIVLLVPLFSVSMDKQPIKRASKLYACQGGFIIVEEVTDDKGQIGLQTNNSENSCPQDIRAIHTTDRGRIFLERFVPVMPEFDEQLYCSE